MIQNEVPLLHCHYRGSKNITSKRDLLVILSSALDDNAAPQNKELNNEKKKTTEIYSGLPWNYLWQQTVKRNGGAVRTFDGRRRRCSEECITRQTNLLLHCELWVFPKIAAWVCVHSWGRRMKHIQISPPQIRSSQFCWDCCFTKETKPALTQKTELTHRHDQTPHFHQRHSGAE